MRLENQLDFQKKFKSNNTNSRVFEIIQTCIDWNYENGSTIVITV